MHIYDVIPPTTDPVPVVISSPHSGVGIPPEVQEQLSPQYRKDPDDTDWFIDRLYDFAPSLGITMIRANLSRYVIDLNRDPDSVPLYTDGRIITGLVPLTTFNGDPLYTQEPNQDEINRRRERYYQPYHDRLRSLLVGTREKFGMALLFDAHSIRRQVPGIRKEPFPDLILGDADGTSASVGIIRTAVDTLKSGPYDFSHNHPFKGGFITRNYGKPDENIHALQLEMSKVNYMDDAETDYHTERAAAMREHLQSLFINLIKEITQ